MSVKKFYTIFGVVVGAGVHRQVILIQPDFWLGDTPNDDLQSVGNLYPNPNPEKFRIDQDCRSSLADVPPSPIFHQLSIYGSCTFIFQYEISFTLSVILPDNCLPFEFLSVCGEKRTLRYGESFIICWFTFHFWEFESAAIGKTIKIKIEFVPKMYKISGTLDVIYIDDIYSKKEVNFNPKNSFDV